MPNIFDVGIIGMGPAGIGLAMSLRGTSKIKNTVCFERGSYTADINCPALSQKECCCSNVCSVISGVGGASTLSSGKISNFPAGSGLVEFFDSEKQLRELLDKLVPFLANKIALKKVEIDTKTKKDAKSFYEQRNIEYKYYDVYEFDGKSYRKFIQETVQELKDEGLQLFDNTEVLDINRDPHSLHFCVNVRTPNSEKQFFVRKLVLATGALDIQDRLAEKMVGAGTNCFEIGVRIEAPSDAFGHVLSTHGDLKLKLGTGRTYCVTVNGKIIAYQTGGVRFLEGCIEPSSSTIYTNLAVLIKCDDSAIYDFINRYRKDFNGIPIKQKLADYINGRVSSEEIITTLDLAVCGDINDLFPTNINSNIKEFIKDVLIDSMGISEDAITLVAPELKILRNLQIDKNFELGSNFFVIGAVTGKFRGILQSFCSGVRCGQLLGGR
jgi:hypothetical protein